MQALRKCGGENGEVVGRLVEQADAAARELREGTRDDQGLALRVPNSGGIASLREVLARLGDGIAVEDLSIHTPDLDDVFFALTGGPSKEQTQ